MTGPLSIQWIRARLNTAVIDDDIQFFPSVDSTMTVAVALAGSGCPDGTVVIADEQTAGRGRFDRRWSVPAETSLLMTIIIDPQDGVVSDLPSWTALAVVDGIIAVTGAPASLKWPNDVLINGRKVAGLLAEAKTVAGRRVALIGMGINVNVDPADLPDGATSIAAELGADIVREQLALAILSALDDNLVAYREGKRPTATWQSRLETIGQPVQVTQGDLRVFGTAVRVDDLGRLIVEDESGTLHAFAAGDVTLRR